MLQYLLSFFQAPELPEHIIPELKKTIAAEPVVVFSKSYCPYCTSTKQLLQALDAQYTVVELNHDKEGSQKQQGLLAMTGQKTVPNVFIKGEHVGGNDVLQRLNREGKLRGMLS